MIVDDSQTNSHPNIIWSKLETFFFIAYSCEMILKILGMSFIFAEEAYIKDAWNVLDFLIVMTSVPSMFAPTV